MADVSQHFVDIADMFLKLSTDFATEAVFGQSTDSLLFDLRHWSGRQDKGSAGEFSNVLGYSLQMLGQRLQLINFYWLRDSLKFRRSCRTCRAFVDKYLTEAQAEQKQDPKAGDPTGPVSFLSSIVARRKASTGVMRDQLLSLLLASRDTTASFLSWTVYALARHPQVTEKLRQIIHSRLPNARPPTTADILALPYLRHVLNETLRIFPVVPVNGRTAVTDTVLPEGGGDDGKSPLAVPAGTKVAFVIYAMHRRRDVFGEDADEFKPERWEEPGAAPNGDFGGAFVPFILGPRVCLGST